MSPQVFFEGNNTYSSKLLADRAAEVIQEHPADRPLFLYLPFQSVHGPLEAPTEYLDLYPGVEDPQRRLYLAMVSAMDHAVGTVTGALKDSGLWDNSIVLFFSDNGGPLAGWPPGHETIYSANNWPLRGGKYTLWEGGTRTVASITAPSRLTPGSSNALLHVTDWFPTLLSAAGLRPSVPGLDGLDQWAALNSSLPGPRQELLYNIFYPVWDLAQGPPISALRQGDWKYIRRTVGYAGWEEAPENVNTPKASKSFPIRGSNPPPEVLAEDTRDQLFNLALDPEERQNLAEVEPEVLEVLRLRLAELEEGMSEVTYPPKTEAADPGNFGGVWSAGWC